MPKKGTVVCKTCNADFTGQLPDHEPVGYHYMSVNDEINKKLTIKLQGHHLETATVQTLGGGMYGHRDFDVFLEDGSMGDLEANSYTVTYTEKGGDKER